MGPQLFSYGNYGNKDYLDIDNNASMGLQLFSYGNYGNKDYLDIDNNASMGPQLFSYGYHGEYGDLVDMHHSGFNGTTTFQLWKS